jgi:exodeoxyribonuclease (lambda-induced)
MIEWSYAPQGTDEWLNARRGRITGSQFKVTRDRLKNGEYTSKAKLYAMDTARERCGGKAADVYVNSAMRFGSEQEPLARVAYEDATGLLVEEVGFAFTTDGKFGASPDGLVDHDGMVEIKTMVSSDTLFKAVVAGEHGEYIDQINGSMWLLGRKWCDLILWAPDLPAELRLTVRRIHRDDNAVDALVDDLMAFDRLVGQYEAQLRGAITGRAAAPAPAPAAAAKATASTPIPADIFGG